MPFYEYQAINIKKSCKYCKDKFEVIQSMSDEVIKKCPECGNKVLKMFSLIGGVVIKNRQVNQYNDCKYAKYWRDQNGVRHKIGPGDGHSNSPTVPKRQTASPDQIKERIRRDKIKSQKTRSNESYNRFVKRVENR